MNTMTWLQNGAAWAWHTSLVIAIPGIILLALGRWRGFSARWRMIFAAALLVRLMLPSVPEIPWHPAASLEQALTTGPSVTQVQEQKNQMVSVLALDEDVRAELLEDGVVPTAAVATPARATTIPWMTLLACVWAAGVLAVLGWVVASHWLIRRWVARHALAPDRHVARLFQWCCERMEMQRSIGLTELPNISTAALCGWLRPTVLVPANLRETHTDDEIRGILLHELAHVRRCDVLWSWLGLAACALHWFNPLAWLALRRFHADRELDCDRMALERLAPPQRSSYAPALFKTLQGPALATSAALVPFFRHKHEIHNRILTIMKPSKSLIARLAALAIIPALSVLTLTTAGADEEKKPGEEAPTKQRDGEGIKKGPRDGEVKKDGPRDGEVKKEGPRDGEGEKKGPRDGEAGAEKKKVREGDGDAPVKKTREGDVRKEGAGEQSEAAQKRKVMRDGEGERKGPRDGEVKKEGARDGDGVKKEGARDGDGVKKEGVRDGDGVKKEGARDGDGVKKEGARDGDGARKEKGPRDGEGEKKVPRDGEVKKEGSRDGEGEKKAGPRDGDVKKEGERDGEKPKRDGDG